MTSMLDQTLMKSYNTPGSWKWANLPLITHWFKVHSPTWEPSELIKSSSKPHMLSLLVSFWVKRKRRTSQKSSRLLIKMEMESSQNKKLWKGMRSTLVRQWTTKTLISCLPKLILMDQVSLITQSLLLLLWTKKPFWQMTNWRQLSECLIRMVAVPFRQMRSSKCWALANH